MKNVRTEQSTRGVLLVACRFNPEYTPSAARQYRFAKFLPRFGYVATVLSRDGYPALAAGAPWVHRVPNGNERATGLVMCEAVIRAAQRVLPYRDGLEWFPYSVHEGRKLIQAERLTAILSTSPPLVTHLVALRLSRSLKVPWVADFQDPLWGNPWRTRPHGFVYDALLERVFLGCADRVIANTDSLARLWQTRYPGWVSKIAVIPNGFDPEESVPESPARRDGRRVLAHVGRIYGGRQPGRVLQSLDRIMNQGWMCPGELTVRLVGPARDHSDWLKTEDVRRLTERGCLNFTDPVPREKAQELMGQSDYLLLLDNNATGAKLQVPGKVFDYIRVGCPILLVTNRNSPCEQLLERSGVKYRTMYTDQSDAEIDRILLEFLSLPTDRDPPSKWFRLTFDARNQTERLSELLDAAISENELRR